MRARRLQAPPAPTWCGYPEDGEAQYVNFVRNGRSILIQSRIEEIQARIGEIRWQLSEYTRVLRERRQRAREYQAQLTAARTSMISKPRASSLRARVRKLQSIPNLLGLRVDHTGCLVAHVRLP